MRMGCATVGGITELESRAAGDVHFKQSDKISNERHAAAPHAVLVFLQRKVRRRQNEATEKRKVEDSVLD